MVLWQQSVASPRSKLHITIPTQLLHALQVCRPDVLRMVLRMSYGTILYPIVDSGRLKGSFLHTLNMVATAIPKYMLSRLTKPPYGRKACLWFFLTPSLEPEIVTPLGQNLYEVLRPSYDTREKS